MAKKNMATTMKATDERERADGLRAPPPASSFSPVSPVSPVSSRPDDILDYTLSASAPPSLSLVLDMLREHERARVDGRVAKQSVDGEVRLAISKLEARRMALERKRKLLEMESHALKRSIAAHVDKERLLDARLTEVALQVEAGEQELQSCEERVRNEAAMLYSIAAERTGVVSGRGGEAEAGAGAEAGGEDDPEAPLPSQPSAIGRLLQRRALVRDREENFIRYALAHH